jgi:hypothetical protein
MGDTATTAFYFVRPAGTPGLYSDLAPQRALFAYIAEDAELVGEPVKILALCPTNGLIDPDQAMTSGRTIEPVTPASIAAQAAALGITRTAEVFAFLPAAHLAALDEALADTGAALCDVPVEVGDDFPAAHAETLKTWPAAWSA